MRGEGRGGREGERLLDQPRVHASSSKTRAQALETVIFFAPMVPLGVPVSQVPKATEKKKRAGPHAHA